MSPRSFLALICLAALWAAFPTIANAMPGGAPANADAARPGYGWSRPKHIQPLLESGHPSIMSKTFGAPYWRALRMRLIMELTSIGPGLWDIMVDVGSAADPKVKVVAVDGFGAKANIPHDAIDPVTASSSSS